MFLLEVSLLLRYKMKAERSEKKLVFILPYPLPFAIFVAE